MAPIFFSAVTLGLSAGFSPGPLSTFVIAQTLRYGTREGLKVALVPLVTDLPIVTLSIFLLSRLAGSHTVLGIISCLGALFVFKLAHSSLKTRGLPDNALSEGEPRSLFSGVVVNFLSPNPYLFWMTVGGPITVRSWEVNPWHAVAFVTGFYFMLTGSKAVMALIAGRSRRFLSGPGYLWLMRGLGILLGIFAMMLLKDGLRFLGLI